MTIPKPNSKPTLNQINQEILSCTYCLKRKKGELVPGEGSSKAKVVFVGEAPGKDEVKTGRPFVGRAGKILRALLDTAGLKEEEVYITSAVKYLPKTYVTPKPADIAHGRIHLQQQLAAIKPKVIVVLGNTAAKSLLKENYSMSSAHGKIIHQGDQTFFLSYHPAAPLYSPKLKELMIQDFKTLKRLIRSH